MIEPNGSVPKFDGSISWLARPGADGDVVLSSRVRLARNLARFPFVNRAAREDRLHILEIVSEQLRAATLPAPVRWIELHALDRLDRLLLVERQLISRQMARGRQGDGSGGPGEPRAVAFAHGEQFSIMVNEEDHIRLQAIHPGMALEQALADADRVDDALEAGLEYAFHPRFGYLTACPTNVGTGARLSVMVHLPALALTEDIEKVKRAAHDMSLAVRGFYGEGSEAVGDFYQISNQTTLGRSERMMLEELRGEILPRVIGYERAARKMLLSQRRRWLEDLIHRAWGTLLHARLLRGSEALQLLGRVRLGAALGILDSITPERVTQVIPLVQPAHLQRAIGLELNDEQRQAARADFVRKLITAAPRGGS